MPVSLNLFFPQGTPPIIRYGRDMMARVVATSTCTWTGTILIAAGAELLEGARVFAVDRVASAKGRCVHFLEELFIAIINDDRPRMKYTHQENVNLLKST
ncbi:hypothetical protein F5888DRAFT_1805668 [Russula emetica]|nr:hypothetical protein F5888DRAFT_1805668 [Russula emetica]